MCGLGLALLILYHFSEIPHDNETIWSNVTLRPNYCIFIGYLKNGGGGGRGVGFKRTLLELPALTLDPPLLSLLYLFHCF